ncbi:Gfo/Idh/MocA family protein [Candidatus Poribacteria bacterium]
MNDMEKVSLAMIGCGQIARAHFRAIAENPHAELVATMDVVEEKTLAAADEYGARSYTSVEAVLADENVDAVVLPLPHHLHCPIAIQAAEAGKHILVEKPMALDLAEAQQMVDAAESAGVRLMVGQSTRFRPEVWAAKNVISQGTLGQVRQCIHQRAWFTKRLSTEWRYSSEQCGGLYLPIFGSHDVDMILWLMDTAPVKVQCVLRSFTELVEAESDGAVSIGMTNGGLASLAFSMNSHIARHTALFIGTEGTLLIERGKVWVNDEEIALDKSQETFVRQIREFVDAVQTDREPVPSGRDVLPVVSVLDAAKESAATGNAIEIGDL